MAEYEPVIGLEIHAELNTKTKMFCDSLNDPDEKHPNINICPVCMGHPGTLPVINQEAVKKVIQVGLALNGEIPEFSPKSDSQSESDRANQLGFSQFDRKNYFYPDLPKGYQISQYQHPLVKGGLLDISVVDIRKSDGKFPISNSQFPIKSQIPNSNDGKTFKRIRITRIHLEEDAGRLIHPVRNSPPTGPLGAQGAGAISNGVHDQKTGETLVDFNRAGKPLMELVTEPDFRSGEEVRAFGEKFQQILRYVGASNADMEKGEMRVEVNISLRKSGEESFGTKVEVKNINSFKYAEDAVNYEIKRQTEILEGGGKIMQETRGWNENKGESFSQRSKEESHDYRYFPEPDLPPLNISHEFVEELKASLPELPDAKKVRFVDEYGIDVKLAEIIIREKELANYFESVVSEVKEWESSTPEKPEKSIVKLAANFLTGDFLKLLRETSASVLETLITPENFGEFLVYLAEDKISSAGAKIVFDEMFRTGADPSEIIKEKDLLQIIDISGLEATIQGTIAIHPKPVEDYKKGAENALQFLTGQVMKETKGKANPKIIQDILRKMMT